MIIAPGEIYEEERGGWPYYIVGRADTEDFGTFDREVAAAVADIEKRKLSNQ